MSNPFSDPSVTQAMRSTKASAGTPMMEIPLPPPSNLARPIKSTTSTSPPPATMMTSPRNEASLPKSPYIASTTTATTTGMPTNGASLPYAHKDTMNSSPPLPPINPSPAPANPYEENMVYPANENLMEELGNSIKKTDSAKILLFMRFINLILSSATIIVGIFSFILGFTDSPKKIIAALYIMCFGLLLLLFELRIGRFEEFIRENFGFMFGYKTRTAFLLFIAIWPLSMGNHWLTLVLALLLFLNALFNYFVVYNHPSFTQDNAVDYGVSKTAAPSQV